MANDAKKTSVTAAKSEETVKLKKASEKKTDTKKTAIKKADSKKPAAKKAETKKPAAKKTAAKKSSVESKVYIQFFGKQVTANDVVALCEADYKSNNKAAVKSIEVYVKPEDNAAYYVVNGKIEGKVSL